MSLLVALNIFAVGFILGLVLPHYRKQIVKLLKKIWNKEKLF